MFWGIKLESGKKYTQVLQKSFCLTMAALGFEDPSNDIVYVVAEVNKAQHVLCSLQSGKIPQQILNLNFTEGELVSFFIEGKGVVHLTGFLSFDDNDSETDSSDEDEKSDPKHDAFALNKGGVGDDKESNGDSNTINIGGCNGESGRSDMNGNCVKVNHGSTSAYKDEEFQSNGVDSISNGDHDINEDAKSQDISEIRLKTNGFSNEEVNSIDKKTSCLSSNDEASSVCSEESETRYKLADNNSKNKNSTIKKFTSATKKKQAAKVNADNSGPRKKKTKIESLKDTQDKDNKRSKGKAPIKRASSKVSPSFKQTFNKTNSPKGSESPINKTSSKPNISKPNSKTDTLKNNKPMNSPKKVISGTSPKQYPVRPIKTAAIKKHFRSERLRTMRKRTVNSQQTK